MRISAIRAFGMLAVVSYDLEMENAESWNKVDLDLKGLYKTAVDSAPINHVVTVYKKTRLME